MRFSGRNWTRQKAVYSFAMADAVVTITGFRDYEIVVRQLFMLNPFTEPNRCSNQLDGWQR